MAKLEPADLSLLMADDDLITLSKENDPKHCPFKPHEYVLIKGEMSAADEQFIQNHSARAAGKRSQGKKNVRIQIMAGDVQAATMARMVKGWNITRTRPDGKGGKMEVPLAFSPENLGKISARYQEYILDKIRELNDDGLDDEESDDDFFSDASDSSGEN